MNLIHDPHCLFKIRGVIRSMQIHQLDAVNLEPFQAGIHLINQSINIRSMQIHQLDTVNLLKQVST